MRQAYQLRLADLGDHGSAMCDVASHCLRDATRARLDEMRSNAEHVALELLALEAPVASDLRTVISAIWIVADLQRMGALAIHVAKAARRRHPAHAVSYTHLRA